MLYRIMKYDTHNISCLIKGKKILKMICIIRLQMLLPVGYIYNAPFNFIPMNDETKRKINIQNNFSNTVYVKYLYYFLAQALKPRIKSLNTCFSLNSEVADVRAQICLHEYSF